MGESESNSGGKNVRKLTVLNMHLIASSEAIWEKCGWDRSSESHEQLKQLNGILAIFTRIARDDPSRAIIVGGDFNITRTEPAYHKMVNIFNSVGLRDVSDQNGVWEPTFACRKANGTPEETFLSHKGCYLHAPRRLDYIFSNGKPKAPAKVLALKVEKHPKLQQVSDHKGIAVTLRL